MATFYILLALFGAVCAVFVTKPRDDKESLSLFLKYPIIGVFMLFATLGVAYYLLRLTDKDALLACCGALTVIGSFFITSGLYGWMSEKKH